MAVIEGFLAACYILAAVRFALHAGHGNLPHDLGVAMACSVWPLAAVLGFGKALIHRWR